MSTEDVSAVPVGAKIKRLREGASLSLEQLADRVGLAPAELGRIEEHLVSPPLGVLVRICDGLGVRLGHFFDEGPRRFYSLVRATDQKVATRYADRDGVDYGYEYRALGADKRERRIDPFLITLDAPSAEAVPLEERCVHGGEEFLYVLEGQIEVLLQDERFLLGPGDSLYYDAEVPHQVTRQGQGVARVLAVVALPR